MGIVLDIFTGGDVFDPHTGDRHYYYPWIANQSAGNGTSTATEGFVPTPIEELNLYK